MSLRFRQYPHPDDSDDEVDVIAGDRDWENIAAEQRREMTTAKELGSDLDLAFELQLQEAINASISLQTASSWAPPPPQPQLPKEETVAASMDFQSEEILKIEQEMKDRKLSELEFKFFRDDLHRRIHDKRVAAEITSMPEDDWENFGDDFENPYAEEESSIVMSTEVFRVYFKGLTVDEDDKVFNAIGFAICDSEGDLLFQLGKPIYGDGLSRVMAEFRALIEGLNMAVELNLKRISFCCHFFPLFQYVTGKWIPKQGKVVKLLNQVTQLQEKFVSCDPCFVAGSEVKFAFKLANDAIKAQLNNSSSNGRSSFENCGICLEDTDTNLIFSVDSCMHRYCYSCMNQHVEAKMLSGIIPRCPHESCSSELRVDSCSKFLTPKLIERLKQRKKEASIPVTERVYCPDPKCSALMSKSDAMVFYRSRSTEGILPCTGECLKCRKLFCIPCKVPWHSGMTCNHFKKINPRAPAEDLKLKTLAAMFRWKQCIKCSHMIELNTGCYHMTCRCGCEFCYTCGAEWKNKKATCECPLWDEEHILHSDDDVDTDSDDDDFIGLHA